ncbi:hypothetical protein Taro_006650 [Colocasia esculenta]|uniref:Retrotransposon gag domain-containing protein n=1 Tax=Colocasia esculenta TaxID=4460 RepID=A0A843TVW6_COLES|nr:hypothetical protein [Colocasia esculenta]
MIVALAFLFRRSLDGPTLEWFYSLELADAEDFKAVQRKFLQRYRNRVGLSLSITDLMAEKMKADEDFLHYADRWTTLTERLRDPLSESEQVKMITANATPQFRHILAMNKLTTMEELYERACYIQTQLKDSPIMAMFEPKARAAKKNGNPPIGGPTTEGVMQHEQYLGHHPNSLSSHNNNLQPSTVKLPLHLLNTVQHRSLSIANLLPNINNNNQHLPNNLHSTTRYLLQAPMTSSCWVEWINIYCKGGVDTPHTGVDTMLQALRQKMEKWSTSVDTRPGQVDTSDRSQRNKSADCYSRSTLDGIRSTLDGSPRELFCPIWDSVSTHPMGRSTHSGNFVT